MNANLRKSAKLAVLPLFLVFPAFAQSTTRGSLTVTGNVEGSISVEFSAGSTTRNLGHGTGAASFTVPTFGGLFTPGSSAITAGNASFLVSSPFGITVLKANLASTSYTLKASLATPDRSHAWKIDGVDISAGSEEVLAGGEFFDINNSHTLVVSGPAPEPLNRDIRFTVIAN
jgi:hypothetical protein